MRGGEAARELHREQRHRRRGEPSAVGEQHVERAALDHLHRQERDAGRNFAEVVHRHHVRRADAHGGARLAGKALDGAAIGGEIGVEQLDGDGQLELEVAPAIDAAHAAGAEQRADGEALVDDLARPRIGAVAHLAAVERTVRHRHARREHGAAADAGAAARLGGAGSALALRRGVPSDFCESRASSSRCRVSTIAPSITIEPAASDDGAHCTVGTPRCGSTMASSTMPNKSKSSTPTAMARTSRRWRGEPCRWMVTTRLTVPAAMKRDDDEDRPRRRPERRHVAAAGEPRLAGDDERRRRSERAADERQRHRDGDQAAQARHRWVRRARARSPPAAGRARRRRAPRRRWPPCRRRARAPPARTPPTCSRSRGPSPPPGRS